MPKRDAKHSEEIAENLKFSLGQMLEKEDVIPSEITMETLITSNTELYVLIIDMMKSQLLISSRKGTSQEYVQYDKKDYDTVKLSNEIKDEVLEILYPMTKEEIVNYRIKIHDEKK